MNFEKIAQSIHFPMIRIYSFVWLAFLAFVLAQIWKAPMTQDTKIMWSGMVIFLPGVGIAMWLLYGNQRY